MTRPAAAVLTLLAACGGKDDGSTPHTGTDDPTTTPIPSERLEDGVYTGSVEGLEDNTCPNAFRYRGFWPDTTGTTVITLSTGNPTVENTGAVRFDVDFGGLGPSCRVTAAGVDCRGYALSVGDLSITSDIAELVIESPTEFTMREALTVDCAGPMCADIDATFPCTVDVLERYVSPADESDLCFDGFDNDQDGGGDHLDDDCPAFTPLVWSVDGEFGYDAAAGGAVPFVLDGVVHPPVIRIHLTAGEWDALGGARPSSDPTQQCTLTLSATGTDPIPLTLETLELGYGTGYPASVTHHTLALPAGGFDVTTDCDDKGLVETASFGTLDDLAAAAWAIGVGEPVFPKDPVGGSSHFGITADVLQGGASAWAVDATMTVTNTSGAPATAADVTEGAVMPVDPALVTGALPLPSGAYVLTPLPAGVGLYLGD